jgi:hypothetical protein
MIAIRIIMCMAGLACIVFAFRAHSFRKKIEEHSIETEAEVIEVGRTSETSDTLVLTYNIGGINYKSKCETMKFHEAGEKVKLLYQIDNPKVFILKEDTGKK